MTITMILLALAGLITHQITKIIGAKQDGTQGYGVLTFWTNNWPHTILAMVGTGVVLALAKEMPDVLGTLTPLTAYLAGLTGGSVAGALGNREKKP